MWLLKRVALSFFHLINKMASDLEKVMLFMLRPATVYITLPC